MLSFKKKKMIEKCFHRFYKGLQTFFLHITVGSVLQSLLAYLKPRPVLRPWWRQCYSTTCNMTGDAKCVFVFSVLLSVVTSLSLQVLQNLGRAEKTTDDTFTDNVQKIDKQQVRVYLSVRLSEGVSCVLCVYALPLYLHNR